MQASKLTLEDRQYAAQIKKQSQKLTETETYPLGTAFQENLMETWQRVRPVMWARLQKLNMAPELAHVLEAQYQENVQKYQKHGMPPCDAREQAAYGLLQEPEDEEEEET